jgi:hypothetical protein
MQNGCRLNDDANHLYYKTLSTYPPGLWKARNRVMIIYHIPPEEGIPMQQIPTKTAWIIFGVLVVIAICGVIALAGGGSLLSAFAGTPTPEMRIARIEPRVPNVKQPVSTAVSGVSTGDESSTEETAVPLSGNVLYQDDFSDPESGWTIDTWDEGEVGYGNGTYQVTVNPTQYLVWSYVGDSFSDGRYSTKASVVAPTTEGDFGILCRLQDDENYYALEVSEDGYFTIWKKVAGETVTLYDWEYSDAIPTGEPFTINAGCVGSTLTLVVNDTFLASVSDGSFQDGNFGVIAGTNETGGFTVAFDDFRVYEP